MPKRKNVKASEPFDASEYLETAGVRKKLVTYRKRQTIFSQGETARHHGSRVA